MTRTPAAAVLSLGAALLSQGVAAAPLDLATVTCSTYESEIVTARGVAPADDPIDTVMWLFGFAVAKAGERSMFGDSLPAFGYGLDAECRKNPGEPLREAVVAVRSKHVNPMDLTSLSCPVYETRHAALRKSDAESANTLTMWLYGYSVGLTDGHVLDAATVGKFDAALGEHCAAHPGDSLFDALNAVNHAVAPPRPQRRAVPPKP